MKHGLTLLALLPLVTSAQNIHVLSAYDFVFDPLVLNVSSGDTIRLALGAGHSFREVPASAWYDNETTPIIGFDIGPFPQYDDSHFIVLNTVDTLYYICTAHLDMGMKGRIVVSGTSIGTNEIELVEHVWYPNPAHHTAFLQHPVGNRALVRLNDQTGRSLDRPLGPNGELDIRDLSPGIYVATLCGPNGLPLSRGRLTVE